MMDIFLGPRILCPTSVFLTLCSHQNLTMFQRQQWSYTDILQVSFFSGEVFDSYKKTDRTATE